MKDIIITTYNGNVKLNNFPRNFKRDDSFTIVRECLKEVTGRIQIDLFNAEYFSNFGSYDGWYIDIKTDSKICPEDWISCVVDYEDYKTGENYIKVIN